ncbi:DUF2156 domain-containing protein [Sinomonas halotolerans]|uniref:DUF2156 domain-containing protein n=1 Tax=Sinomonas halotolerans TaxID=1644133 RepID=A0ABU9WXN2_9MICC
MKAGAALRAFGRWAGERARRHPLTAGLVAALWTVALSTGSLLAGPSAALLEFVGADLASLRAGHWWGVLTSLFFVTNPLAYAGATILLAVLVPLAERAYGTVRAAALFFGGHLASLTAFLLVTQVADRAGELWLGGMADDPLLGPYPAALFAAMAASPALGVLWRRRLRAALLGVSATLVLYVGHSEAVLGLIGALLGLAACWWSAAASGERAPVPSVRERRNLLALLVALLAVGPVLTALARSPSGPFALVRDMVLNPVPAMAQLQQECGVLLTPQCLQAGIPAALSPVGYATALIPTLILLVCAEGLRRGRAVALHIVLAVQLGLLALIAGYLVLLVSGPAGPDRKVPGLFASGLVHLVPIVVTALAIAALLWLGRGLFPVQTAQGVRRRLAAAGAGLAVVLVTAYSALWWAGRAREGWGGPAAGDGAAPGEGGTAPAEAAAALARELVRQYLPAPIPAGYTEAFRGRTDAELWLFTHSGLILWTALLVLVAMAVLAARPTLGADEGSLELARGLVRRGGGPLSWMTLWQPNRFWFDEHGTAGLAYQLHGSVALSVAGPIGVPGRGPSAVDGFIAHCARHALTPCFYAVSADLWPHLQARGFRRVEVAQETRLHVRGLEFTGREWQNVRTALNRARKLGVAAVWTRYADLPSAQRSQLGALAEEWSARKPLPELGFTLGGIDELDDPDVRICLALDRDGRLHGATSWLPVFEDGRLTGWTLDFMRRGSGSFPGAMEFLVASAVLELREEVEWISLSGSPLASDPVGERAAVRRGDELLSRLLDAVGKALEPVYGFRSLARFKSRFQPEYHALYMYYHDPLELPAIGRALAAAYLPGLTMRHRLRLLRSLVG